jgi:hypothetical protein
MPIIDDYEAIAKRARELKLPVQAQSHKVSDLEKWREAALETARAYVQTRRRDVALGPMLPRRPRVTD